MTYDYLRRLCLHGLIVRVPHTNTYTTTPGGMHLAVFFTKVHDRLADPLLDAAHSPAPPQLRQALATMDRAIAGYARHARGTPA